MSLNSMILSGAFNAHNKPFIVNRAHDNKGNDICIVDNSPSEEFNENDFGWIRNDFSTLLNEENVQVQQKIIARLNELPRLSDNSGLSDDEIISSVMPRGLSDIVDYERHVNSEVSKALGKYREELELQERESAKKIENPLSE